LEKESEASENSGSDGLCTLLLASQASTVSAAEIKALITIAMQSVFEELAPQFEKASGHKLAMSFALRETLNKSANHL